MSKRKIGTLLAGIGIGIGLGMLLSPKSGKENRAELKKITDDTIDMVKDIDLEKIKNNLLKDYDKLVSELKNMDREEAIAFAKEKGSKIASTAADLIKKAKKKSKPIIENAAKDIKKKTVQLLKSIESE